MMKLEDFSPFSSLTATGKSRLREGVVSRHAVSEAPLLFKGQQISGAYFVLEGRLRVYSLAPNGTEATMYLIDAGETCVFALNSLFNDLLYPAWVQAVSETALAFLPGPLFGALFAEEPVIRDLTVRTLSTLVFRLMAELEEVHSFKLNQRLANLLLTHASSAGTLAMTRQQMAFHLGTTREVVARLLGEFVALDYVETRRGVSLIRDVAGLRRVVSLG